MRRGLLQVHWQNGVRVLRIFGHLDGYVSSTPAKCAALDPAPDVDFHIRQLAELS